MTGFYEHLLNYRIFLASRSPRRQQLMEEAMIPFTVWLKEAMDETIPDGMDLYEAPGYLARKKARVYLSDLNEMDILITADTVVVLNQRILGKPNTKDEAREMLLRLSGVCHEVVTGVCITSPGREHLFDSLTRVWFEKLTGEEIDAYIDRYLPFDKAGSYGIQEWIGYVGVSRIEGSFFNVMGLPVQRLYQELKSFTHYNR